MNPQTLAKRKYTKKSENVPRTLPDIALHNDVIISNSNKKKR